jgi:DNA-binding winged helix-turn-helix (wHTH) protein
VSLTFGPFRVIPGERLLLRSNQPVCLPSNAYEILVMLLEHSGQLVPKSELIERVSASMPIGESQLRVYISKLRKALEDGGRGLRYVENINGHGYRFVAPVTRMEEHSPPFADGGGTSPTPLHLVSALPYRMIAGGSFEFGPFELIPGRRLLLRAGRPVNVPSRAWEILLLLIERAGELVGKADLLAHVWPRVVVEEGALRVHISWLRRTLGDRRDGLRYIENVTGLGYRFVATVHKHDREKALVQKPPCPCNAQPPMSPHTVSREDDLTTLLTRLSQRLLTITGPGGVDKTTRAISAIYRITGELLSHVRFVDPCSIGEAALMRTLIRRVKDSGVPSEA